MLLISYSSRVVKRVVFVITLVASIAACSSFDAEPLTPDADVPPDADGPQADGGTIPDAGPTGPPESDGGTTTECTPGSVVATAGVVSQGSSGASWASLPNVLLEDGKASQSGTFSGGGTTQTLTVKELHCRWTRRPGSRASP